jgi:hypothetical protein
MNKGWRSISHLKLELDEEGLSQTLWLRNGNAEAMGFYCDLGVRRVNGDDDFPPTSGWYDADGRPLTFTPVYYRPVDETAEGENPPPA